MYREFYDNTPLVMDVLQAREDEGILDLALRIRKGDEAAAKEAGSLPKATQKIVLAIAMAFTEPAADETA